MPIQAACPSKSRDPIIRVVLVRRTRAAVPGEQRESPAIAGAVTEAFSRLAAWIVPLLLLAGLVIAALLLPSLDAIWTSYGLLLLAKLGAFAALMLLGALNKWRARACAGAR